jgi:hypothetical protein
LAVLLNSFDILIFYLQEQNSSIDIPETIFFSFIGQGVPINPNGLTGRVLLLSVSITGAVIFWSYSAGLVSFLTVDKIDFKINTYSVGKLFVETYYCSKTLLYVDFLVSLISSNYLLLGLG